MASDRPDASTEVGVVFPEVDGSRSTTATGRAVFADAARPADAALAGAIASERAWHKAYIEHVRRLVAAQAQTPGSAIAVAAAGLASARDRFRFRRGGEEVTLDEALGRAPDRPVDTVTVPGTGTTGPRALMVPYRGEALSDDRLRRQLDDWQARGIVEPSFVAAIGQVIDHPDWLDLSDQRVAVLGAGAELGPFEALCQWGAEVHAVDIPRPRVWERILVAANAGTGRVHVPVSRPVDDPSDLGAVAAVAGIDVIAELPELAAWLHELPGPLTVGNYVYADGADHVRATVAVDALLADLTGRRDDVTLAVLATPTDVYAVPEEVVDESRRRYDERPAIRRLAGTATGTRVYAPAYPDTVPTPDGARLGLADSMVAQQGPNYALAKRLQQWRAMVTRDTGHRSSINVAPATSTRSVTKNKILAAAYAGAPRFDVEVFEPPTANVLMAAMLVHDLRADDTSASPDVDLEHPLALYWRGAAHGGLWRQPFAPRTVLPLAAVAGWRALLR